MKLLQVAEQNKKYYTKEFIHGFNTGAKTQYEADKKDVRHGRWVYDKGDRFPKCSVCRQHNGTLYEYRYCPTCGALLDGDVEYA